MLDLDKDYIEKLYKDGLSIRKIGVLLGHSDKTIRNFMIENNISIQKRNCNEISDSIKRKIEQLYIDGFNPREIGEKVDLPASKIKSYLVHNDLWISITSLEKEELKYMYNIEKLTMREIATRKNCSLKKVEMAIKRFKIKKTKYCFNKIELNLLYTKYNISIAHIAEMKETTPYFVKKALKQYDIA